MDLKVEGYNPTLRRAAAKKITEPGPVQIEAPATVSVSPEQELPLVKEVNLVERAVETPVIFETKNTHSVQKNESDIENLKAMAERLGFVIKKPRTEFIKHTYSVTPENKEKMKKYCDSLGFSLQDAMAEAMELFFDKHKDDFQAVTRVLARTEGKS